MKRRHTIFLTVLALLLAIPLVWTLWPEGPLDLSKDEEPFRSMVLPPETIHGTGYMDGGSVGFQMIDKNGVGFEISFPIDYDGILNAHPTAYRGNFGDPKMSPLKDPARAKAIVIRLLKDYGKMNTKYSEPETAIRDLSEPFTAVPSRLYKRAELWFNDFAADW